jgi:hypothetical protein
MFIDPIYKYTMPTSILKGPYEVLIQRDRRNPKGVFNPLGSYGKPTWGRILRLKGIGLLSEVTADTGTMEVDGVQASLLVAYAREYFFDALMGNAGPRVRERYREMRDKAIVDKERFIARGGRMLEPPAQVSSAWRTIDESGTRYLELTHYRG